MLVKDRIPYDLHNTGEIMIMQMRREGRSLETASDPEITEMVRQRDKTRGVFAQIISKHKHKGVAGEHECRKMTECQKQVLITNNNKQEKHKPKPDKTENMTMCPHSVRTTTR